MRIIDFLQVPKKNNKCESDESEANCQNYYYIDTTRGVYVCINENSEDSCDMQKGYPYLIINDNINKKNAVKPAMEYYH